MKYNLQEFLLHEWDSGRIVSDIDTHMGTNSKLNGVLNGSIRYGVSEDHSDVSCNYAFLHIYYVTMCANAKRNPRAFNFSKIKGMKIYIWLQDDGDPILL